MNLDDSQSFSISVIIPLYNGAKYIEAAVISVINQTLPPDEIIIVDDGSTDNGADIVRSLSDKHPIQFIKKENGGQSSARNLGVSKSKGDLIAFLDQDDFWYPDHLEELIKPFLSSQTMTIGWVYGNVDEIDEYDNLVNRRLLDLTNTEHPKNHLSACIGDDMYVLPCASLVLREAFEAVGGFDERLSGYEDDDLFLRIFRKRYDNIYIEKPLGIYRIQSQSSAFSSRMIKSRCLYISKLLSILQPDDCRRHLIPKYLVPRFLPLLLGDYKVSIVKDEKELFLKILDSLKSLIPYLKINQRIKYKIILQLFGNSKLIRFLYVIKQKFHCVKRGRQLIK